MKHSYGIPEKTRDPTKQQIIQNCQNIEYYANEAHDAIGAENNHYALTCLRAIIERAQNIKRLATP